MDEEPASPETRPNSLLTALREHRFYGAAVGYLVAAWVVLQVAAIVLPGFGAPVWVLRALMIVLALGLGLTLLAVWGKDRRARSLPLVPTTPRTRLAWTLTAILPALLVAGFFLFYPDARRSPPSPVSPAPAVSPDKSVAVLPFDHFSADQDSAFFADGVQDEVLTDLAHVADLKVISRSSVMQYRKPEARSNLREIGQALGVAYIVEGSVQRSGNQIRVTATLIDARTDAHKWAEKYDRPLDRVFDIQSEIAQAIAEQLQAVISPQEQAAIAEVPTRDAEAYALYLQARGAFNNQAETNDSAASWDKALRALGDATKRDPQFARAYSFAAIMQALVYRDRKTNEAQAAIIRGLVDAVARLRPDSVDAHHAAGVYDYYVRQDFAGAREHFSAALRLVPNDADTLELLALSECRQGLWTDALAHNQKAIELDPNKDDLLFKKHRILKVQRRFPEALAVLDRMSVGKARGWAHLLNAEILVTWKADLAAAQAELASVPAGFDPDGQTTLGRLNGDFCARDFAAAERDLAACPLQDLTVDMVSFATVPRSYYEGLLARYRGDNAGAKSAFAAARPVLEAKVRAQPMNADLLFTLASTDAALGRSQEALAEGRHALAIARPENDAFLGPVYTAVFASVLTWTGQRDEAIRTLQALVAKPGYLGYGDLKLHPDWDPLRGDPRFETMVASLAPKQ